jgi:hypothetical protein
MRLMPKKKINSNILKVGDLLHYCPVDLREQEHELGLIYDIEIVQVCNKSFKKYKVYWQRTKIFDEYSASTLNYKLNFTIGGKHVILILPIKV